MLTESTVLAVLGGVIGVAFAFAGTRLILHRAFRADYVAIDATPSLAVLAFTFTVSLVTGILFGVAPAWITVKANPAEALAPAHVVHAIHQSLATPIIESRVTMPASAASDQPTVAAGCSGSTM